MALFSRSACVKAKQSRVINTFLISRKTEFQNSLEKYEKIMHKS